MSVFEGSMCYKDSFSLPLHQFIYPHQQISIDGNITHPTEAALSSRLVMNGSKTKNMKINRYITSAEQELLIDMFLKEFRILNI